MKYDIISTGSKGNAVVIQEIILIDCGVSYKALKEVRGGLKLVLLTHAHSDHFCPSTIRLLANNRPTLRFAGCPWMIPLLTECGVSNSRIDMLTVGKKYDYGIFSISPVQLYHDVPNCGYRIYMNGKKLFYATDTNTLAGISAKDYDLYMVEANFAEEEIRERIKEKQERGEYAYEVGVIHSHLSKEKCDEFICENIGSSGRFVYLHQHKE